MKILYISSRYDGGIGGHAKRVAEKLCENGFDIELMKIPHLPIKNLKNPSFTLMGTVKAIFNSNQYDLVHAWNIPSALVMKKINAKKKILSIHGIYGKQIEKIHSKTTSNIGIKAEKEALKIANIFTTDSKFVKNYYKNELGYDFIHLPAPVDELKFREIKDIDYKENQIIYIGRNSFEKGIDILKTIEDKIDANVEYCTDEEWSVAMKKLKKSLLLVVPSRMESIPQVIKEAFLLKIPVIATNVGGIPELIENQKTGILVTPEDPESLLNEINNLISDKERQTQISNNAFQYVMENYTWESLLPRYVNFYQKILNEKNY